MTNTEQIRTKKISFILALSVIIFAAIATYFTLCHDINERYQQDIRLNLLAELVGMAPSAFSRFFKLRTGKTLSAYITDIRIGYAARMLVDTQRSIAEICYDCGFNNLSNFNRIFKKKKNCSPKEFRDNYKKTKIIV